MWAKWLAFSVAVWQLSVRGKAESIRATCDTAPVDRVDCGFGGITKQQCEAKGCCFNTEVSGIQCFFKRQVSNMIECGFEDEGVCGYTQKANHANTEFVRNKGKSYSRTLSSSAGITSSSQGNFYVYLYCKKSPDYKYTSLISPVENEPVFKKCLQFSYNMHGNDVNILKVFMKTAIGWGDAIWRKISNQGEAWQTTSLPITSFQPFQIVFQAHAGSAINCDIAVDDVKIIDCPDAVLSESETYEPWTEWKKCDQSCGANYRSRVRFWFSRESKRPYNFTYHIRYSTADKPCPEEHRWYLDDLADGAFTDEYGTAQATVMSGNTDPNDRILAVKTGQESVKISFPHDSCIFGVKECEDGFTLSFWINLQNSPSGSSIISPEANSGLKITLLDSTKANIVMTTNEAQWSLNATVTTATWTHVTVTWSKCHGLTYYENGHVQEHSGLYETMGGNSSSAQVGEKVLFIGKSRSADGAVFSMIELVIWKGMISPTDVKALYLKIDQAERFMFLKASDKSLLQWRRNYTGTPSNNTGPNIPYLRSEFDIDDEDYRPSSCEDIMRMGRGNVDGYYVIFPRGACRDFLKVWCSGMNGSTPKAYIDVDPALNYAIFAGMDAPCQINFVWRDRGKTWFNKIQVNPDSMVVNSWDHTFATATENYRAFAHGGACYSDNADHSCAYSGSFQVNLVNTSVRVKPTVNWRGSGWWQDLSIPFMVNFRRSPDSREISANCGGHCGICQTDGDLVLELASCVEKKPRSCADVKYFRSVNQDGNYTIYPYSTGLMPLRVYCARMTTDVPKEYINVLQDEGKNFAHRNKDSAYSNTCTVKPGAVTVSSFNSELGHSRFSKIRLDVNNMVVARGDHSFSYNVFGDDINYGTAGSCFSQARCLPRGFFNIDLTGTGLKIKPDVSWERTFWPSHFGAYLTIHEDFYRQVMDGNCGAYCGSCWTKSLEIEIAVPDDPANWRYFGEKNLSLIDSSDEGRSQRNLGLSKSCSVAVGIEDGRIPDSSFAVSSSYSYTTSLRARLRNSFGGWRSRDRDQDPWLQINLLFVRLVTGFETHANAAKYAKTFSLSFGFDADQLTFYQDRFKQTQIFKRDTPGDKLVKEVLLKPFFARYVRFSVLTFHAKNMLAVEIYICPRGSFHHMVMSGDFYFLESSYPGGKGDRGDLVTRIIPPVFTCVRFMYHMIGSDMGRLGVHIEETSKQRLLLWSVVGEQRPNAWKKATIPLDIDTPFRLIFVRDIGDGFKSDIAVGGVTLMNDNCTFNPSHATPGPSCVPACTGRSKCDNVTGKCVCLDEDFVGENCENQLLQTIYKDAFHYWSFDDPENITDLKTGVKALVKKPVAHVRGPVNLAFTATPIYESGLDLGEIRYSCLEEPSICPGGLTISAWIKANERISRINFFNTNYPTNRLGVVLVKLSDKLKLVYIIQGTKHKCNAFHNRIRFRTWMFVSITWSVASDGTGKLVFYLIDDTGVKKYEKLCPEESGLSFGKNLGKMSTLLERNVHIGSGYSLDELAVWNSTLTEERIMEIYNLVTRNPSNFVAWTVKLEPHSWSRALVDKEIAEHEKETGELSSRIGEYINNSSISKIREEFATDLCIYSGSVRAGVATWRENILRCTDPRFALKSDSFNLKLHVKNGDVNVNLNNINVGSIASEASNTPRAGFFWTNEANSDAIMMKDFNVETNKGAMFTFEDCDMTQTGGLVGSEGEYTLYGTQTSSPTDYCMAIHQRTVYSTEYKIEVKIRHDRGKIANGEEYGHMGVLFEYESSNNFAVLVVRSHNPCFTFFRRTSGANQVIHERKSCSGGYPEQRAWHIVSILVGLKGTVAYFDGSLLVSKAHEFPAQPSKVGVVVFHTDDTKISFKDFRVEEYFVPVSGFLSTSSFQLPSIEGIVDGHGMISVLGDQVTSVGNYTVSGEFQYTTFGAFGLCYNIMDDSTFDFVYYRRARVLYAEVTQSVLTTAWEPNENLDKKIETSSLLATDKSSTKVPTNIPFNISSFAINPTALNFSWDWSPDYDVTGLFQGFKVLYRNEEVAVNSWKEIIVYGREFESTSSVILSDLRKGMEYFLKVVAFSLVGDGWPSQEIRNSTMDDVPDMIDLNMTVKNVDLQSVLIEWDLLPKYYWNSNAPSYLVLFQDIVLGKNITVNVAAGTSQLNYTQFKHFTNYSVSLMAKNHVGTSSPTGSVLIETLDHVPAIYPSNLSVTILNTSALTVSWNLIDEALWQGLPLGYVIYCNHSDEDQRNITVSSSTREIIITNLTAFTVYDVTMAGYTRKGLGPKYPTVTVRTHEEVPPVAPVNIRILNQTDKQSNHTPNNTNITPSIPTSYSTTLEWDPVPANVVRGIIRGYTVTYGPVEVYYITRARRSLAGHMHDVTLNTTTASIELGDLLFYTNYSVEVRAYTVDNGAPSLVFHFITPEGVPVEGPEDLHANHDGSKSKLSVKWSSIPVDARNGVLLGYNVYYHESLASGPGKNLSVTETYVVLTELETFTSYDIRVCGFTAVGDGVCSQVTAVTRSHDLAPYTAPWNVTIALPSPVSISLLWKPFPEGLWYDYPRGYRITFQRVALGGLKTSGDDVTTARVDYQTGSYSWSNLAYYTKYKIEISTFTYRGYGPKSVLYAETCHCPTVMSSSFYILPPYVTRQDNGELGGIFPDLIQRMTSSCCVTCPGSVVDFEKDGLDEISEKRTYPDLSKSLHQATTFAFPIIGHPNTNQYASNFGFVPGVESPGMVVIVKKKSAEHIGLAVLKSILGVWPILLINISLALLAGIVMWILDSSSNEDIFPRRCIRGSLEGFWWAFVSMTTVGYGDTTAKSFPARIFSVIWILTGLCLYSILTGDLTSALSSSVSVSKTSLYGAKVAVLINSTEESAALRRNAKVVGGPYYKPRDLQKALLSGEVDAAMLDIYAAGLTKELWNHTDLRMSRILDYSSPYGIVMAGGTDGIQQCFQSYMKNNRIKILDLVLNYTTTLKGVKNEETTEYVEDLIDGQSEMFRNTLLILCISIGVFVLIGMVWNYTCRIRRSTSMKKDNSVHPEKESYCEIFLDLKIDYLNLCHRLKTMKKQHGEQIRRFKASQMPTSS